MRTILPMPLQGLPGILCLMFGLGGLVGCGEQESRLTNTMESPEEVCQRTLDALASNDTLALQRLRLTQFEHDSLLVPQMPAPAPGVERDMGMAWYLLEQNNIKGIRRALYDYGGKRFSLVRVRFTRPDKVFGPIVAHRGTEVTVRDSTGAEFVLPIFGSIVENNGRYKLVSIRD